jgi:hypothetical protein
LEDTKQIGYLEEHDKYLRLNEKLSFMKAYWYALAATPIPFVAFLAARYGDFHPKLWLAIVFASLAWAGTVDIYAIVVLIQWFVFRCPRCGWRFGGGAKCGSCGLPRSAPSSKQGSALIVK